MIGEKTFMREEQRGINGSDIGAIMGVNKNKSASDVYLEKIKLETRKSSKGDKNLKDKFNETIYLKNTLKEVVAREFSLRTGKKVRKENKQIVDEEYDFIGGNIERKIVGENSILMCKVVDIFSYAEWANEEIPARHLLEAQHCMRISKAEKCYLAYLIGHRKFIYKEILRDDKVINMIIQIEKDFWLNNVINKIPPKC